MECRIDRSAVTEKMQKARKVSLKVLTGCFPLTLALPGALFPFSNHSA